MIGFFFLLKHSALLLEAPSFFMFYKAFTCDSFAEVLLSLPKVPKSAFRLTGNIPLVGCESRNVFGKRSMNKFSLSPQSAAENVFYIQHYRKISFRTAEKSIFASFSVGFSRSSFLCPHQDASSLFTGSLLVQIFITWGKT